MLPTVPPIAPPIAVPTPGAITVPTAAPAFVPKEPPAKLVAKLPPCTTVSFFLSSACITAAAENSRLNPFPFKNFPVFPMLPFNLGT